MKSLNRHPKSYVKLISALIIFFSVLPIHAQIDVLLTQHRLIPTILNPAAAGNSEFIRLSGAARIEALGISKSPKSFMATLDSPFRLGDNKIGAGIIINNKTFDFYRNYLVSLQGSYIFNFGKSDLSIGLQAGYYHSKFLGSKLSNSSAEPPITSEEYNETPSDGTDNLIGDASAGTFDLSFGILYSHPKFHFGISALHLTNPKLKLTEGNQSGDEQRYLESKLPTSLYFETGGNIALNNTLFTLQPSLLAGTDFSTFEGLLEMQATYNGKFSFGVDYRYNRAVGVLASLTLKNFFLGYSWEYDYKFDSKGNTGNHELVIGYRFKLNLEKKSNFRQRSIRIM